MVDLVGLCLLGNQARVRCLHLTLVLPPLVGLTGLVLILAALIVVEATRYAQARRSLRNA